MLSYLTGFDNEIFEQFEQVRRQMDRRFGERAGPRGIRSAADGSYPAINIGASLQQVDVYVFAADMAQDSLNITIHQNLLTVAGERKTEIPEGAQMYRNERFSGDFRRAITLPEDVDPERVAATYYDGVLHITVQRCEEVQPRKIEVK